MIKKSICCPILLILALFVSKASNGYDDIITHPAITEKASEIANSKLDQYLKNNIGFNNGLATRFDFNNLKKTVREWLKKGATDEDSPNCRASNHFHNPLLPWNQSYTSDDVTPTALSIRDFCNLTGWPYLLRKSDVTWATGYLSPSPDGKKATLLSIYKLYNWDNARNYYFKALTLSNSSDRESYFAQTFETLGHILHLLQDVSVPAHVRNDFESHLTFSESKSIDPRTWFIQPFEYFIKVNRNMMADVNADGNFPTFLNQTLTNFWDTDQYAGSNPSSSTTIGLAEYANGNFLSDTTIFRGFLSPLHSFPYPAWSSVAEYDEKDLYTGQVTTYLRKVRNGETINHLAAGKWYYKYLPSELKNTGLELDDKCHYDYAVKLLPRAIGYSAGLLNYFFRGDILLSYTTDPTPGYVLINNSGERMSGDFTVYYDNAADERYPIWAGKGSLEASIGDKTNTFDIASPNDAKKPGKYIVVFKGKIGNEDGAVAGYVFSRVIEITPPDQFIYSMVKANQTDPEFTNIRVKLRNTSNSEAIQAGVIQMLAKYKKDIDDGEFTYSASNSKQINSLSETEATEFDFNFENNPIPIGVTDLSLQVIFKGKVGTEENAVAIGIRDISEPTAIDIFNNMDRICINGKWYVTSSVEAYNALPDSAKWWDYWTHDLKDLYVKVSPINNSSDASSSNYTFYVPMIQSGTLYRMYMLSDYDFAYSGYGSMIGKDPADNYIHDNGIKKVGAQGIAFRNQTEYSNDPAYCSTYGYGTTPCTSVRTSSFHPFRGIQIWGTGSFIIDGVSYPNYTDPGYIRCSWDELK